MATFDLAPPHGGPLAAEQWAARPTNPPGAGAASPRPAPGATGRAPSQGAGGRALDRRGARGFHPAVAGRYGKPAAGHRPDRAPGAPGQSVCAVPPAVAVF